MNGEASVLSVYKLFGMEVLKGLGKVPRALVVGVALFPPFVYFGGDGRKCGSDRQSVPHGACLLACPEYGHVVRKELMVLSAICQVCPNPSRLHFREVYIRFSVSN